MRDDLKIGVVGATGVVGREVLAALYAVRTCPPSAARLLGSERSKGLGTLEYGEDSLEVEQATRDAFTGPGLVLLATPAEASRAAGPGRRRPRVRGWWTPAPPSSRSDGAFPSSCRASTPTRPRADVQGRPRGVPAGRRHQRLRVHVVEPLRKVFGVGARAGARR